MKSITWSAALIVLTSGLIVPAASATRDIDLGDVIFPACPNPGSQGTIITLPYFLSVTGTGWVGSHYYVYGTWHYEKVERYNYCVAGTQVGAVSASYSHSSSFAWCVTCITVEIADDSIATLA